MRFALVVALLVAAVGSVSASAQEKTHPVPPVIIIDMDESIIEASVNGPNDHMVATHAHKQFKSLIQVRKSFSKELLATASQLAK